MHYSLKIPKKFQKILEIPLVSSKYYKIILDKPDLAPYIEYMTKKQIGIEKLKDVPKDQLIGVKTPVKTGQITWQRDGKGLMYLLAIELPPNWWVDLENRKHALDWMEEEGITAIKVDKYHADKE